MMAADVFFAWIVDSGARTGPPFPWSAGGVIPCLIAQAWQPRGGLVAGLLLPSEAPQQRVEP